MARKKKRKNTKRREPRVASEPRRQEPEPVRISGRRVPHQPAGEACNLNPHYFLFFLLIVVLVGCYNILEPYLHPIILAFILATLFNPVQRRIEQFLGGRKNRASLISCVLITLFIVLPFFVMTLSVIQQGGTSLDAIAQWIEAGNHEKIAEHPLVLKGLASLSDYLPNIKKVFPDLDMHSIDLEKIVLTVTSSLGKTLLDESRHLAGNVASFIGKFFLMLFTFFFFVRDEEKIVNAVLHLIPLSSSQERRIILKVKTVAKSALLGTLVTAVAQGFAGGLAFWIAGLPGIFWGMMMAFASLVPVVGTALIWLPAAGYLLISGQWGYAIFMVSWCVIVVGMIDNFVRPLFMQDSANMSTLLIFFAILGGINQFGLIGILYGPLIFGLAMVLLYIYQIEFGEFLSRQDER